MSEIQVLQAELTWIDSAFQRDIQVQVGIDGRISAVGPLALAPTQQLSRVAILPGLVNAHSHAFQRGLRGRGETFPQGTGSFWGWREAMYDLVESLTDDGFAGLTRQAFCEMRDCGITTVGEFHYLHHSSSGRIDFDLDQRVLQAAKKAGVRLVLLNAYYKSGGVNQPLAGGQRRFSTPNLDGYWQQMDKLQTLLDPSSQSVGVVAHSLRAVDPGELAELHAEAKLRGLPFHVHLEEQPQEIEDVRSAYGKTPVELVLNSLDLGAEFTAVHCTHTPAAQVRELLDRNTHICVCPLTEANLGDGLPDLSAISSISSISPFQTRLCLGTDSNARISLTEESRWLEYGQRLRHRQRGVIANTSGDVPKALLSIATQGGAGALGVAVGTIQPGRWADLVAIGLDHPSLSGWDTESLLGTFLLGAADDAIAGTWVGGRWRDRRQIALRPSQTAEDLLR